MSSPSRCGQRYWLWAHKDGSWGLPMKSVPDNLRANAGPHAEKVQSGLHYMTARQLLSILRRHRWLIGAIVAGVTLITAVAVFTATPIFEATATARVELVGGSGDEETANAAQNEARMETEARLYATRAMAEAVNKAARKGLVLGKNG